MSPIPREALSSGNDREFRRLRFAYSRLADLDLDPVDAGPLTSARYIEPAGMLAVQLAYGMGLGPSIGLTLQRRLERRSGVRGKESSMEGSEATARRGPDVIALVTGANRGIGYEICRQLAGRGAQVVLTARDPEAGERAVRKLGAENLPARFHPLSVTDPESIPALRDFVERTYGRLDVLVNNAGIIDPADAGGLEVELAAVRNTLETNTLAPLRLSQALAPLLRRSRAGRIVNVSSGMGALSEMEGGNAAYRISKTALNAVTRILAAELWGEVSVNSMCPGWVRTDMGGPGAQQDVREGADTAVWLALDAPQTLTGRFLRDRQVIDW
jgi:NAD(P)-dependent dehydrogenase (short-subunit alcohol dehydrogenase family)